MKKHLTTLPIAIAVVGTLTWLIIAFGQGNNKQTTTEQENTLDNVRKTGTIEACTVVNPPTVIKDAKTGELSGHVVDALYEIAKRMNVEINWHESTWGNAAADLQSKRCDILAATFFASIPRAQAVAFAKPPFLYIGHDAIVRKDDERFNKTQSIFDFDKPDIKVVVATGEAGDIFVKEHFKEAQITRIDAESSDLTRFILEVSTGRADVAIGGSDTTGVYARKHPEVIELLRERPYGLSPIGWAVRQDDYQWLHFIETSLQFLETQGVLRELEEKYDAHWLHDKKEYELW